MTTFLAIVLPVVVVATWIGFEMIMRARREYFRREDLREALREQERRDEMARSGSIDVGHVPVRLVVAPDDEKETQP